MFDFFRKPIFLIILAAALIIAAVWAWIANRSSNQSSSQTQTQDTTEPDSAADLSNLTNVDAASLDDAIAAQLGIGDAKAAEVDRKLALSGIEVDLSGDLTVSSGVTYLIYSTPNDANNNWVIAISNSDNKFVRSRTVKDDFFGQATAINRSYWKQSYVAALQAAEKAGGMTYREANPPSSVRLTLKNSDPHGWLYWFVDYVSSSGVKTYQIDANAGTLVTADNSQ